MNDLPRMTEDVLLSVHIPKTAGITLYNMYKTAYAGAFVEDYPDRDPWKEVKYPAKVIHGHFELQRYLGLSRRPRVVTFVREPLARAISHFHYWETPPDYEPRNHPLYVKHFVEKEPSLHDFLLDEAMANIMSSFLYPFCIPGEFFFVGVCEYFDADVADLQSLLGLPIQQQPRLNAGQSRPRDVVAPEVAQAFYELNSHDKIFYDRALSFRSWRISNPLLWRLSQHIPSVRKWFSKYHRARSG